jgi:hypothetical protein
MKSIEFTARHIVEQTLCGKRYTFYCGLTGLPVHTTDAIQEADPRKAEHIAREQARPYFNRCAACGKWVGDAAYNIDEMKCTACAPCDSLPSLYIIGEYRLLKLGGAPTASGNRE